MAVNEVIDDMLRNEALYASDKRKLDEMVMRRLLPRFNFRVMTQLAAGRYWREASHEQKATLVNEFRTLLVRTYTNMLFNNIDKVYSYLDTSVAIGSSTTLPNGDATVGMKITGNTNEPISVTLRMRRDGEDWKVIDVSANGVSLVVTYRASFAREANLSGIEGLIKSLADRNRANSSK